MCDDCIQYIHNVDMVLKDIQNGVDKSKQNLLEYKNEFKTVLKENENGIKKLLEAIEKRYEERFKKIDNAQKMFENNIKEVKKLYGLVNDYENNNKQIFTSIEENNNKMCSEIKKALKETSVKNNKISYAEATKNKPMMPDVTRKVPLIIKPKEKQESEKTRAELNKIDPVNLKIKNVENRKNGTLVIETDNDAEREKIKKVIQNEMSEGYEIKVPNPAKMSVVITDITFEYSEEELMKKIKMQNPIITESEIEVSRVYAFKRNNKTIYNAKINIDYESYGKLIKAQKVNVGWEKCRVFDGTEIIQCFKCKGFNHIAKECRNEEVCLKCHENHRQIECNRETLKKCINCARINKKLNLDLDENHYTMHRKCPVYRNKLSEKQRRLVINF